MASIAVDLARAVAKQQNETIFHWPVEIVPESPARLDTVITSKWFVVPQKSREDLGNEWFVATAPDPNAMTPAPDAEDHCGRAFDYTVHTTLLKRMNTQDADGDQPATLIEIETAMSFGERMAEFTDLKANRQPTLEAFGRQASLVGLSIQLVVPDVLRESQIFQATITGIYRFKA